MTDEVLKKANDNRREYEHCTWLLGAVTGAAGNTINIGGSAGSFNLPSELNGPFIEMMTNYLKNKMSCLDEEYRGL